MKRELTAQEHNRLQIEQQIIRIKTIENALTYSFKGKSMLWGSPVTEVDLTRAKNDLAELDRLRGIYEGDKKELKYFNSPGSITDKVKAHFDDMDGMTTFVEVKPSSTGRVVVTHVNTKSHIQQSIKRKTMATKKAAVKKAAKKAAPKKAATKKAFVKNPKSDNDSLRARVDAFVAKGKSNAEIIEALDKDGFVYSVNSVRWYASKARAAQLV